MPNQERLSRATKAVNARLGFFIHLGVFVVVNALLLAINLATSATYLWVKWSLLGWGLGLALHAALLFFLPKARALRQRMIAREMGERLSDG